LSASNEAFAANAEAGNYASLNDVEAVNGDSTCVAADWILRQQECNVVYEELNGFCCSAAG
jgi:hypothetical protein